MAQFRRLERRTEFDSKLRAIATNVYYQPPPSIHMDYPCIRYNLAAIDSNYANNLIYTHRDGYDVTVIDRNPDSEIPNNILDTFKRCRFDRSYVADNLHHFVFRIYY